MLTKQSEPNGQHQTERGPNVKRKHVLLVIEKIAGRSGGAERVLVNLANALHRRNYYVEVITHERSRRSAFYDFDFGIVHSNICPTMKSKTVYLRFFDHIGKRLLHSCRVARFYPIGMRNILWWLEHIPFSKRLGAYIDLTKPDTVVAFLPPAITALSYANLSHSPKLIGSLHNVPEQDFNNPSRWDPNPIDRERRIKCLYKLHRYTVLLESFLDFFPPELRQKAFVLPNSVPIISTNQERLRVPQKIVLSVGRLSCVKQHTILIAAWEIVAMHFPDWVCHIYGSGPLHNKLQHDIRRKRLEQKVVLKGHTKNIFEEYKKASILAHPAKFEGWGLSVSEALGIGVPSVAFEDCPGANALIIDGYNGKLAQAKGNRIENFASCLMELMGDEDERRRLSLNAPHSVCSYNSETIYNKWENLL